MRRLLLRARLSAALPSRFLILGESAGILDKLPVRRLLAIASTKPSYLRRDGPPAVDGETIEPSAPAPWTVALPCSLPVLR
jgi:hypothetical protein